MLPVSTQPVFFYNCKMHFMTESSLWIQVILDLTCSQPKMHNSVYIYVTRSDKRVTKSLGKLWRDNCRKHYQWVIFLINFCAFYCFTIKGVYCIISLLPTAHFDIKMTLKHSSNDKKPTLTKAVSILSAPFFTKCPLYYPSYLKTP